MALTEGRHTGEFLVSEANGFRSREQGVLVTGQDLAAGTVLGALDASTATATAFATNVGNGTMGAITVTSPARSGIYTLTITAEAVDAGTFKVEDPDGQLVADDGTVAAAFSDGGLAFTLADGVTDFDIGDGFFIEVRVAGDYAVYDPTESDGSETVAAVLYDNIDATLGAKPATVIVRDAEVNAAELVWFDGASAGQIVTGTAELAALGIIAR